jgi:hypothetical protein
MTRCVIALAVCFLVAAWSRADTPDADTAIRKAIEELEKAKAATQSKADARKLGRAVAGLKGMVGEGADKTDNALIPDFIDNAEKYKGKTLTFRLRYDNSAIGNLRDYAGGKTIFAGTDPERTANLLLTVYFPSDLDIPKVRYGEEVVITFTCDEGSTSKGNVATAVKRP